MVNEVSRLKIEILSDEVGKAELRLGKLEAQANRTEKGTKLLGVASKAAFGVMAAASAAATAQVAKSTREWLAYDKAMKEVDSITNQSAESFQRMRKDVLQLSAALGVDATKSARGLYQALSAGVPKENAIRFLETATKAAIAGVTDVSTSVDGLTNIINAYKLPVTEAESVSDKLFATVKGGKTTFEELSKSMSKATVPAASLGVSLEELLASTIAITKQGTPTAEAMTQIKATLNALLNPSSEMASALRAIGHESARSAIEAKGFGQTLELLRNSFAGNDAALVKAFRSTEALGGVLSQTGKNLKLFEQGLDDVNESGGSMAGGFQTNAQTLENSIQGLQSAFVSMIEDFEGAFNILEKTAELINGVSLAIVQAQKGGADVASAAEIGGIGGAGRLLDVISELEGKKGDLRASRQPARPGYDFASLGITQQIDKLENQLQKAKSQLSQFSDETVNAARRFRQLEQAIADGDQTRVTAVQASIDKIHERAEAAEVEAEYSKGWAEQDAEQKADELRRLDGVRQAEAEKAEEAEKVAARARVLGEDRLATIDREIEKINQLRETGIISEEEIDRAIEKLREEGRAIQEINLSESLPFGLGEISDTLERRKSMILDATRDTEEQRLDELEKYGERAIQARELYAQRERDAMLAGYSDLFGGLAELAAAGGEENFRAVQALSIAQATVKMYESAVSAYAQGAAISPFLGPVFATGALAAGAANIAAIKAQEPRAYAHGGFIGAGSVGLVGEAGPEIVKGPAFVTSANQTRHALNSESAEPLNVSVNVTNLPGQAAEVTSSPDGRIVEIAIKKTIDKLTNEAQNGTGKFVPTLSRAYNMKRKGR